MPVIVSTKTGFPEHYYPQNELLTAAQQEWQKKRASIVKPLEQFYTNVKVNGRYLAWPLERYQEPTTFEERNNAYIETALALGKQTICALLDQVQMGPQEIDQLTTISTTGIAVPALDGETAQLDGEQDHGLIRVPLQVIRCPSDACRAAHTAEPEQGQSFHAPGKRDAIHQARVQGWHGDARGGDGGQLVDLLRAHLHLVQQGANRLLAQLQRCFDIRIIPFLKRGRLRVSFQGPGKMAPVHFYVCVELLQGFHDGGSLPHPLLLCSAEQRVLGVVMFRKTSF